MTDVRITTQNVEVVQQDDAIDVQVTQMVREAVIQETSTDVQCTQMWIELVHSGDCPTFEASPPSEELPPAGGGACPVPDGNSFVTPL